MVKTVTDEDDHAEFPSDNDVHAITEEDLWKMFSIFIEKMGR